MWGRIVENCFGVTILNYGKDQRANLAAILTAKSLNKLLRQTKQSFYGGGKVSPKKFRLIRTEKFSRLNEKRLKMAEIEIETIIYNEKLKLIFMVPLTISVFSPPLPSPKFFFHFKNSLHCFIADNNNFFLFFYFEKIFFVGRKLLKQ